MRNSGSAIFALRSSTAIFDSPSCDLGWRRRPASPLSPRPTTGREGEGGLSPRRLLLRLLGGLTGVVELDQLVDFEGGEPVPGVLAVLVLVERPEELAGPEWRDPQAFGEILGLIRALFVPLLVLRLALRLLRLFDLRLRRLHLLLFDLRHVRRPLHLRLDLGEIDVLSPLRPTLDVRHLDRPPSILRVPPLRYQYYGGWRVVFKGVRPKKISTNFDTYAYPNDCSPRERQTWIAWVASFVTQHSFAQHTRSPRTCVRSFYSNVCSKRTSVRSYMCLDPVWPLGWLRCGGGAPG